MFAAHDQKQPKGAAAKTAGKAEPSSAGNAAAEFNGYWQSLALGTSGIQAKLSVSQPNDPSEQEADRVAERVMRMVSPSQPDMVQRKCAPCEEEDQEGVQRKVGTSSVSTPRTASPIVNGALSSPGRPLDAGTRAFMEPRFNHDFGHVRVHTDTTASESARAVNAMAFTLGRDVVFGPGHYQPESDNGRRLLAHELAHVVQQEAAPDAAIQRVIEVRPPGRGEATAFPRANELIDRMNLVSRATDFSLDPVGGREIHFVDRPAAAGAAAPVPSNFEERMRTIIGDARVIPMRLITSAGRVGGGPLLVDSYQLAYVDLDDLLASDDISFQMNLIHLLVERFSVTRYANRIGSPGLQALDPVTLLPTPEFRRAHAAGTAAEAEFLREAVGDPTLRFNFEERKANGTEVFAFRSDEGYRIFHVFRRATREERHGEIFVETRDGRRLTLAELMAERAAAAAAAAAPAAAPAVGPAGPVP